MKKDLSHLLRKEEPQEGFESLDSAKEYLARYLLNYINIELEGLPKEEWDRTLRTWAKICSFAKELIGKSEKEREGIYERFRFDMVMQGISEDVRRTFIGMLGLGLLKADDPPHSLILKATELVMGDEDLMKRWELNPEIIKYVHSFYTKEI